jgi:hypothetical protein
MGVMRNYAQFWAETLKGRHWLEDMGIGGGKH